MDINLLLQVEGHVPIVHQGHIFILQKILMDIFVRIVDINHHRLVVVHVHIVLIKVMCILVNMRDSMRVNFVDINLLLPQEVVVVRVLMENTSIFKSNKVIRPDISANSEYICSRFAPYILLEHWLR